MVEFRLFGGVEACLDGRQIDVGPARQRCILAILLVEANTTVSADQLVDRVWADRPPLRVRSSLYSYLTRLRRALGTAQVSITRRSGGYVLTVDEQTVDLHRFHHLISEARTTVDDEQALALLEQALRLWRGEAFAGLDSPWLHTVRTILERERLEATVDRTDLMLRGGQHAALVSTLSVQVGQHPLHERVAGQFMLALYRSGHQADALNHYQLTRMRLADELGVDPSPPLQQLHRQILTADPALAEYKSATAGRAPVPRQLPAAPRVFVGRERELDQLTAALDAQTEPGTTVVISAIAGAGGIGKTSLALHWAHQHIDRFPDGQLHADLRGFDPSGRPTPTTVVIHRFLEALGVDPAAVPMDFDAQMGLYRSLVAGKRMLIVLDNARDTNHVAALIPGGSASTVLITSRNRLTALITTHGAHSVTLDVLDHGDAGDVLTRHLGDARVTAELAAVDELLSRCARLPLALGILAARAVTHPERSLTVLAEELRDHASRLDALDTGEINLNLRAVLSWSYHALNPAAATLFGQLGLAPGPDFTLPAVACLTGLPATRVAKLVPELEAIYLVQQPQPGRYRMHDLVSLYAAEQAHRDHPQARIGAARRRLVDHYLHTAHAAETQLNPAMPPIQLTNSACSHQPFAGQTEALDWFAAEHANLIAIQQLAAEQAWHAAVWQLAWTLSTFHHRQGRIHDNLAVWHAGLMASQQSTDLAAQILAHRRCGYACARAGRHAKAVQHLQHALILAQDIGDTLDQAHTQFALAGAWEQQGDDRRALAHATQALHLYQTLNHSVGQARALGAVGLCQARLGHHDQARTHCEAALVLCRRHKHGEAEASTLDNLGYIAHRMGQHTDAVHHYRQALTLLRTLGNNYQQADTLDRLAQTHAALGQHDQTHAAWRQALTLYRAQHRTTDAERIQQHLANLNANPLRHRH